MAPIGVAIATIFQYIPYIPAIKGTGYKHRFIAYLLWYGAIDILGGAIGMLLNSTYVIWVVLIDILILGTTLNNRVIIAFIAIFISIVILAKESRGNE